jgi:hypothetical protein
MTLDKAIRLIKGCLENMNAAYRRTVFNEWAIVRLTSSSDDLLFCESPRGSSIAKEFAHDFRLLREESEESANSAGEFSFTRTGTGSTIDSFVALGSDCILVCNHTELSIDEITRDPLWKKAQLPFLEMTEAFSSDPLTL